MVRAGEGGYLVEEFEKTGHVGLGFEGAKAFTDFKTQNQIKTHLAEVYPGITPSALANAAAIAFKFRHVIKNGDRVVTYDPKRREYLVGTIGGDYRYDPEVLPDYFHVRAVHWSGRVSRDSLSTTSKNTLGSTLSVFEPGEEVLKELETALDEQTSPDPAPYLAQRPEDFGLAREDAASRSHEFIKDRILKLSPDDMEALTAGLLRAMGYKTRVSPKGRDRGRDVVASPDGLGFLQPRIIAQVKHTRDPVSRATMLAFAGVLQDGDKALFVSTGGFSNDAKFESERVRTPITLVDLDELASLVVEYYDKFDSQGRSLLPLVRMYWPA
jgi:restriction system protein